MDLNSQREKKEHKVKSCYDFVHCKNTQFFKELNLIDQLDSRSSNNCKTNKHYSYWYTIQGEYIVCIYP